GAKERRRQRTWFPGRAAARSARGGWAREVRRHGRRPVLVKKTITSRTSYNRCGRGFGRPGPRRSGLCPLRPTPGDSHGRTSAGEATGSGGHLGGGRLGPAGTADGQVGPHGS